MEITILGKLFIAVLIAAIIGAIAGFVVRRGNDAKVGLGCGLMFPVAIVVFVILQIVIPDVVVIADRNGMLSHENKSMIMSLKDPSGQKTSLSLCDKYIANFSSEPLIYYPAYYGPANKANSVTEEEPIIIKPHSVISIKEMPDYYFSPAAEQISSKSDNVEVRWVLESLRSVAEREGYEYEE